MKVVILAGGLGTRLSEETHVRPKPMAEIGGKPILWHLMKIFSSQGYNEFIICCGYKSHVIKDYFANYTLHQADVTFDMKAQSMTVHKNNAEEWKVTLVETGENSMTGGRLKRVQDYLEPNEPFFFTYGDGLSDIDLSKLLAFHKKEGRLATVTAVQPPGRFGVFTLHEDQHYVDSFREKPVGDGAWISGGFFVLHPDVIKYIDNDATTWEQEPMRQLAEENNLSAYRHTGFWHPMDSLRDKKVLEDMWNSGKAAWKLWE